MIGTENLRLYPVESTGVHDSVTALALLSAAGHVGAVLWALSGDPSHEITTQAGSAVLIEVTLVAGPARGSPGEAATPEPDRPATASQPSVPQAAPTEPAAVPALPDRATNADRVSTPPASATNETALNLPPAAEAPPVPPPKPDRRATIPATQSQTPSPDPAEPTSPPPQAAQTASARDADDNAASERLASERSTSARSTRDGSSGGNRGAAPRADNPAPSYPASARRRGQEGRVILRVVVLPDGDAGEVVLEKSSGVESLDQAALETVRRWRFSPARRNGRPVSATVQIPIRFALN